VEVKTLEKGLGAVENLSVIILRGGFIGEEGGNGKQSGNVLK